MKAWSVIGLLFAAVILATVPVSPQVTPRGSLELTSLKPRLTPMGVRAGSIGVWTGATIAMPDGLTGAVTNGAAPRSRLVGGVTHGRLPKSGSNNRR